MPQSLNADCMNLFIYRHLQRKHPQEFTKYSAEGQPKASSSQGTMLSFIEKQAADSYGPHHPQQTKFIESLTENLIVACELPISVVERPEFISFIHDLNPKLNVPTCQFLTNFSFHSWLRINVRFCSRCLMRLIMWH